MLEQSVPREFKPRIFGRSGLLGNLWVGGEEVEEEGEEARQWYHTVQLESILSPIGKKLWSVNDTKSCLALSQGVLAISVSR